MAAKKTSGQYRNIQCWLPRYEVIRSAIERIRELERDERMPKDRALELICADYLSGNGRIGFSSVESVKSHSIDLSGEGEDPAMDDVPW
jgi:hypothetical protein